MTAKMHNLEKIKARLAKVPETVQRALEAQLDKEADDLAAAVKRAVPVLTGTLRDTVRVEDGARPLSKKIVVGDVPATRKKVRAGVADRDFAKAKASGGFKGEYDYALGVEFGHRTVDGKHVPAEPFLFPTYRAKRKGMKRRMAAASRKALRTLYPKD